jgi:hypothetical protein
MEPEARRARWAITYWHAELAACRSHESASGRNQMRNAFKNIIVALALTGAILTGANTARADNVSVSFHLGDVAIGFSDGYWDHYHHWHKWGSSRYRHAYEHSEGAEYHGFRHTRMANNGWHDRDDHHWDHHDHHDDQYDHH